MSILPVRAARWSALHPWRALGAWLAFAAVCLAAGMAVGNNAADTADYRVGEAGRAETMAAEAGLSRRSVEHLLISTPPGRTWDRPAADAAAADVVDSVSRLPVVAGVVGPIPSSEGDRLRVDVVLRGEERAASDLVGEVAAHAEQVQGRHPSVVLELTGRGSIGHAVEQQRGEDITRAELITLPVTLIVLFLVFGSVTVAVVPILLALSSIVASIGLSMLVSHVFPDAGVGMNVILLIGMAVGVDYSLFYLKREREERDRAGGRLSSAAVVELAAATSGRAVVVSGVAVAVSSATLYLVDDVIFSSLATGAVLVTLVAVVGSVTVLPAMLAALGGLTARRAARRRRTTRTGGATEVVVRAVARRPGLTLAASVGVLLVLAAPVLGMRISDMGPETHPRELAAMQAYDRLIDAFPEVKAVHEVVVRGDGVAPAALAALDARASADPAITGPAEVRRSADGGTHVLSFAVPHVVGQPAARESLHRLRETHLPATLGGIEGVEYAVSGDVARHVDYPRHQLERLPWVLGALLIVTFAITAWAFRSVVLAGVGVALNLLSAAAALGVLVLVFQERWAQGILDFTSTGSIGSRVPLFLFVILFGLSMDYQVFLVSRIRESLEDGASTRDAVFAGMRRSSSVITSAAAVMFTVFAAFVGVHLIELKQTGFSLAVAVLLDAFVVRTLVLPSVMVLLGDRSWWPSRVRDRTRATSISVR